MSIAYYSILGKPLIFWAGILTFLSLVFTATIAMLNVRGINKINMKYHFLFAKVTIALAIFHAILGISNYI